MAFLVCISPHDQKAIYLDQRFYELIHVNCRESGSFRLLGRIENLKYKSPPLTLAGLDLAELVDEITRLAESGRRHQQLTVFATVCADAVRNGLELTIIGDMHPEL